MSYKLKISPKQRAAGRLFAQAKSCLVEAALKEGLSQQAIAVKLDVNRSVVNRLLRGESNLTLRSIAELAWAMGYTPKLALEKKVKPASSNYFESSIERNFHAKPVSTGAARKATAKVEPVSYVYADA